MPAYAVSSLIWQDDHNAMSPHGDLHLCPTSYSCWGKVLLLCVLFGEGMLPYGEIIQFQGILCFPVSLKSVIS